MIVRDLSQAYANGMPHAPTIPAPAIRQVKSVESDGYSVTELSVATHIGTHIDAPSHLLADGSTIDQLPAEALIRPAVVASPRVDGPGEMTAADLEASEAGAGSVGDALLVRTGWGAKFGTPDYREHPYLSEEAARWIVERGFGLVGFDLITPEVPGHLRPEGFDFPVHRILLGAGVLIMEHLYLEEVIGERPELFIGALKVAGGDGAPARVLAVIGGADR